VRAGNEPAFSMSSADHHHSYDPDQYRAVRRRRARRTGRIADLAIVGAILGSLVVIVSCAAIALGGGFGGSNSSGGTQVAGPPDNSKQSAPADTSQAPGGFDPSVQADPNPQSQSSTQTASPDTDLEGFSESVVADVQDSWKEMFAAQGTEYRAAQLSLYSGGADTGCGSASSAVGPFYCPADETVYIDPSFYDQMRDQLGASGDFAWAYVIAHELGHHVQSLMGTMTKVSQEEQTDPSRTNELSVRTELQADCYAGVWGQTAYKKGQLEDGDLQEGLNAAAAVGDDKIQSTTTGSINPDSFTHGTSAQRVKWFKTGFDSGKPDSCDTFAPASV
jgi:predicted metalloprotease